MSTISLTTTIEAPLEKVFHTVADVRNFSKAVPDIVDVEMLSEVTSGEGTRFRERRVINGREAATELEVTDYVENERIRLVADSHGTVWDSVFSVSESNGHTELTLVMEAKPYKLLSRLMNLFMKGAMTKALRKDMEAVKRYCESDK